MNPHSILIANRGEISIRIARACSDLGLESVAVYTTDDAASLHVQRSDRTAALSGVGAAGYLDVQAIIDAALSSNCQAIHPGYGFLSESEALATACAKAGLTFVGPSPEVLALFGDKVSARIAAAECGIQTPAGTTGAMTLEQLHAYFKTLKAGGGMMIKASAGGGGRGMRVVKNAHEIDEAYARCRAEAQTSFGRADLYAEELINNARHIEIQILGDGTGCVTAFGERECSLQRSHQKLVEIAPSPSLSEALRANIADAALKLAAHVKYRGLGTFEFLVERDATERFVFIEANPRLQVEHTITEAIYDVDLVQAQIRVCLGATLADLRLTQDHVHGPRGCAVQMRLNMETMQAGGGALPSGGTITGYAMPGGPDVRVDGFGYVSYRTSSNYDSLLAKIIVHSPSMDYTRLLRKARRALDETVVSGIQTNRDFLIAMMAHADVAANDVSTRWIDENISELLRTAQSSANASAPPALETSGPAVALSESVPEGWVAVRAPMQGSVALIDVKLHDGVRAGQQLLILEAMKMQHVVLAASDGFVREILVAQGDVVEGGQSLALVEPVELAGGTTEMEDAIAPDFIRSDLAESLRLHAMTLDAARADSVERRHRAGNRTARENIDDLVDSDSFVEYGALAIAAQRSRHSVDHLRRVSPADGLIGGLGTVNASQFGAQRARTVVVAYDYMVFAGTQGSFNHKKQDRLFRLAADLQRPLILFAEGGGGRPGDTDKAMTKVASLDQPTFKAFAHLSGLVPLIGVANGRCFAGNAALLGCCDVIIATRTSNIGLGGPAMIEGGGLGIFTPEQVGPADIQTANGVIDVLVDDEKHAVLAAKKYLSYFQGAVAEWTCGNQRILRHLVPENRLRAYDVHSVIDALFDNNSVLELRAGFAKAMVTALARMEGRPVGVLANNPMYQGGAIDAGAADKAARFIQLCEAHDIPLVSLCDTPGFMVGPDAEKTAQVRRVSRMFVNTATRSIPLFIVVLRKSYGLGALAMSGGNFGDTTASISWPTGEFGGMGLEGAVRLAYKKELAAIGDDAQRQREFERRVAELYEHGKALNVASVLEIDDVVDPSETRRWICAGLEASPPPSPRSTRKRSHIETW